MGHLYHGFVSHNQRVDGQISPPTRLTTVQGGGVHRHRHGRHLHVGGLLFAQLLAHVAEHDRRHGGVRVWWGFLGHTERLVNDDLGMDQYLLIPFLGGWTSIYQLFRCSPGVQGFDTLPSGWWFQTCFFFHDIWENPSHWLIFFKMVKNHQPDNHL